MKEYLLWFRKYESLLEQRNIYPQNGEGFCYEKSCLLVVAALFMLSIAFSEGIILQPGLYRVGEDFPAGEYTLSFPEMKDSAGIQFSTKLDETGEDVDMSEELSFGLSYNSFQWAETVKFSIKERDFYK